MATKQSQGYTGKLYFKTSSGGTFTEAPNVKDVKVNISASAISRTTREHLGFNSVQQGLRDLSIEFQVPWNNTDAFCAALRTAVWTGSSVWFRVADAALGEGPEGEFVITDFPRNEAMNDGMVCDVKAEFGGDAAPTWYDGTP